MIVKKRKRPETKREFNPAWIELEYLCAKIRYWLYERNQRLSAKRYLTRLQQALSKVRHDTLAILRHEGLALAHELDGDLGKAIASRKREIALIERLNELAADVSAETRAYMLQDCGPLELQARREILASLQKQRLERSGNLSKFNKATR